VRGPRPTEPGSVQTWRGWPSCGAGKRAARAGGVDRPARPAFSGGSREAFARLPRCRRAQPGCAWLHRPDVV